MGESSAAVNPNPDILLRDRLQSDVHLLSSAVTLPNGVTVRNRLVKSAMEEGIAHWGGLPGPHHRELYRRWGEGNWGTIITGNVQVDPRHLATPHDLSYPDSSPSTIAAYSQLYQATISSATRKLTPGQGSQYGNEGTNRTLALVQLSHPGLQSSSTMGLSRWPLSPAVAPVSARPELPGLMGWAISRILWPRKSRILSSEEWIGIVKLFVDAARGMEQAGWDGVQIHSAHGYLLAEWMSPLTNPSPFPLPGVPDTVDLRLHLIWLIVTGIRTTTSPRFTVSVKVNCSDFVHGGLTEDQAASMIKEMVSWRMIDILEASGGTYSSPTFASPETVTTPGSRQSLFAHFTATLIPQLPSPPDGPAIILTGGMHNRSIMASSLRDRACDLVGVGRPACIYPDLPKSIILNPDVPDSETRMGGYQIPGAALLGWLFGGGRRAGKGGIPLVGAGLSTLWHEWQLCRIGRGLDTDLEMHWIWGGVVMELLWYGLLGGGPLAWISH